MNIGEKVKKIRSALGLTQNEFAKPLHVKGSYISEIEKCKKTPSDALLDLLMAKYNISEDWWEIGEGELFTTEKPHKDIVRLIYHEVDKLIGRQETETDAAIEAGELLKYLRQKNQDSSP
jgi:transcriptional regulator with XRE-family HTH domain